MAAHNAETLEDGKFLVSRQGHYWRISFYWKGSKHTTCAWLTREQAESEAQQRLRTLSGVSRAYRGLGLTPVKTNDALHQEPKAIEHMSVTSLRVLAHSYGISRYTRMRRQELIDVLRTHIQVEV